MQTKENNEESEEVISIQNLWAGYGNEIVLEDINLSVKKHDFIGLIGPNGGGKTTLIKVILGLLQPIKGEVRIMGKKVKKGRRHIGYVPQNVEFDSNFPINVWEVAQMGRLGKMSLLKRYTSEDDKCVEKALHQVEMLDKRNQTIGELSGGQRQRVYIARALAKEPEILILDEPTSSVDPEVSTNIHELLKDLNEHIAILMVSHDMNVVSSYVKTVGCLNRKLFYHGDKELTSDMVEEAYQCPIDLIAHGVPHRVLSEHSEEE